MLKWNTPNTSSTSIETDVLSHSDCQRIVFHQDLTGPSSLWTQKFIQGIRLIVFDPIAKLNSGDYICSAALNDADISEVRNSSLMAQTHITVLNGNLMKFIDLLFFLMELVELCTYTLSSSIFVIHTQ